MSSVTVPVSGAKAGLETAAQERLQKSESFGSDMTAEAAMFREPSVEEVVRIGSTNTAAATDSLAFCSCHTFFRIGKV